MPLPPVATPAVVPTVERTSGAPARLDFIDGLRGVAILLVLLCHCWHLCGQYAIFLFGINLLQVFDFGNVGLGNHLFTVLSGFCLALPLTRIRAGEPEPGGRDNTLRPLAARSFWSRRFKRLAPAYYAAILLVIVLAVVLPSLHRALGLPAPAAKLPAAGSVAAHALFLHSFFPPYVFDIAASYWSLGMEAQFYLLFPLLVWAARRWGLWQMVAGVALVHVIYRTVLWTGMPLGDDTLYEIGVGIGYTSLGPGRLLEFALGMAAAVLVLRHGQRFRPRLFLSLAVLGLAAGMTLSAIWGRFAPATDLALAAGLFFGMLGGASYPALRRLLEWRPLVNLGVVSYSVYLIHEPVLREVYALLAPWNLDGWQALLVFEVGLVSLLIACGHGFYRVAERPFLAWGKRRSAVALREQAQLVYSRGSRNAEAPSPPADPVKPR